MMYLDTNEMRTNILMDIIKGKKIIWYHYSRIAEIENASNQTYWKPVILTDFQC